MSYVHHTILLVDADQDMAHFAMLALQRVGVISPVQLAGTARDAMAYLSGHPPYADRDSFPLPVLLLLDLELPDLSGLDFLSWVRAQPGLGRLPVIVLTRPGESAEVNRAYELGCNSYLVKPTSFNTLLVMMQTLVQYWLSLNTPPELCYGPQLPHLSPPAGMGGSQPEPGV